MPRRPRNRGANTAYAREIDLQTRPRQRALPAPNQLKRSSTRSASLRRSRPERRSYAARSLARPPTTKEGEQDEEDQHGTARKGGAMKRKFSLVVAALLLALAAFVAVTKASSPSGVTPTVLARGTFDAFKVKSVPRSPVDFQAKAKSQIDFVVRRHDYDVGSTTGWHSHPGPVFITVTLGQLTYYEYDDPSCEPHVVSAGQG